MKLDYLSMDLENGLFSDSSCQLIIHIADPEWDQGPRLIIRYSDDSEIFDAHDDDDETFKVRKRYHVKFCDKQELINLRDLCSKAIELWPQILKEDI